MKKFRVWLDLPRADSVLIEVQAKDPDEAVQKALDWDGDIIDDETDYGKASAYSVEEVKP